jgi:hypothetical protein
MITQASLYCAAAALIAALYFHFILRLARVLKRKFHIPTMGLAMLPLIVLTIALLYLELVILQSWLPALAEDIGGASLLGLTIGRMVPGPGGGAFMGFGSVSDDIDSDSDDGGSGY